ncbi:sugar ABC transporter ATP-binding protein [Clostridium sp. SYSU_GA19001]|uniref:sugar ABC transporter ATP-binding protein n=1 Tax=Clostridium caldaquaticum TaxID=2940653 RepID=UPI00207726E3|nr:sugar ABC transporter ATP-binding protein [Clostridium caldaquaticum]MCM8710010.1 sugar ABC transporter ATP-binding protein [Clostridium caldaquaticum]
MKELLLQMNNIHKQFNGNLVLNGANFSLYKGEVHALVGENGSGKSTLINILAGIYSMDEGEIILDGKSVSIRNPKQAENLGIGTVFQDYRLFDNMTVAENIFAGHEPTINLGFTKIISWRKLYKQTVKLLNELNVKVNPKVYVSNLDFGKKKMIEVARAISNNSKIIIMDEPTAALNALEIESLTKVIMDLKASGVSIIYISHQINEIKNIADRVTVLKDGKTSSISNKNEISSNKIIKMIAGEEIKDRYPKLEVKLGKEVLIVKDLSVDDKLKDVSFSLKKGEILGITGLRGSGKTALANVLFGIETKTKGIIYVKGKKFEPKGTEDSVKNGICYVNSNKDGEGLISQMSVSNNIISSNVEGLSGYFYINEKVKNENALKYIKMLGIKVNKPQDKVKYLSGGTKKKVLLAKWLFKSSKILILNNPTSGIDVSSKVDVYNILNEVVRSGASVIYISSDISELLGMCDRIMVMRRGTIVKEMKKGEANKEKILYYASGESE